MKTLEDIPDHLRPCFQFLLARGWMQVATRSDDYVLGDNTSRYEAHLLHFPEDHVAVVNQAGTEILIACRSVTFLERVIDTLK